MRFVCSLLLLSLASSASAGQVTLEKKGFMRAYVFVDGEYQGRLSKKEDMVLKPGPGAHEVAVASDRSAKVLRCATELRGGTLTIRDVGCPGVAWSTRTEDTVFRGAKVVLHDPTPETVYISVDGRPQTLMAWTGGNVLNLRPGTRNLVIARDVHMRDIVCSGSMDLSKGKRSPLTVLQGQCVGLDEQGYW